MVQRSTRNVHAEAFLKAECEARCVVIEGDAFNPKIGLRENTPRRQIGRPAVARTECIPSTESGPGADTAAVELCYEDREAGRVGIQKIPNITVKLGCN